MKIFYAIQATGNGHIARAIELMPYLQQYGNVDIFLSGSNANLDINLPVKYRSKGISLFYGNRGGLNYWKMFKSFSPVQAYKEARSLPVEQYDIVINDFEAITSLACRLKHVPSVNFGHQASFISNNTPRPLHKDLAGELVLKYYAPAKNYVGLHFKQYDDFIFSPVIKDAVLKAEPTDKGHVTVYLSHYSDEVILQYLQKLSHIPFQVFSKKRKQVEVIKNVTFIPVNNTAFTESMITAHGIVTGAGFETPAEALYLGKKLLCLPIRGQYEQLCNAAALKDFNVKIVDKISETFPGEIENWLLKEDQKKLTLQQSTYETVQHVIDIARNTRKEKFINLPGLLTEEDLLAMG
ncbi:MAG: glycosyl transferase [Sphingobacteriia bacterium]|nr:glycosyl transferase [Sphingobacteriia bacterium]